MGWQRSALAYCSNVHPGESADALEANLSRFLGPVRQARGLDRMAAGLWISEAAVRTYDRDPDRRAGLRRLLDTNGIRLTTLNGFPVGNFHAVVVKDAVYRPHWADERRLEYSLALARLLVDCAAEGQREPTISTLPLGFRAHWSADHQAAALANLCRLANELAQLEARSGTAVRFCLEMEPGCVLQRTDELIRLFREDLPAAADRAGVSMSLLERHLGACFDVCHQAVMFEDVADALRQIVGAGIAIGKIQLSSALAVPQPEAPGVRQLLSEFDEPRYLHQTVRREAGGGLRLQVELGEALAEPAGADQEWRIHFHVPLHRRSLLSPLLRTTVEHVEAVLDVLAARPDLQPELEVETYTWQALPAAERPDSDGKLVEGLCAELAFIEQQLARRGLLTGGGQSGD